MKRRTLTFLAGALAVLTTASAVDLYGIDDLPFYTRGEPREAVVVKEMAQSGQWVLPMRGQEEIAPKPPLFHWLGLATSSLLGDVSEFSARLPSALLALAITLAVYAMAASTSRIRCGWLAAIALTFSFEWFRAARTARVDMTFAAFVSAALLLYAIMDRLGATRNRRIAFYAALTLAILAKGPAGLLLPMLVVLVYATTRPVEGSGAALRGRMMRLRETADEIRLVPGVLAALSVAALWYTAAWAMGGQEFLETHLWREHVFRVLDAERFQSGHAHGPLYLFGQFLMGAFPWSLSAPAVAWWLWRQRPLDDTRRFLVVWFLVVFAFFLIPDSKRGVYLLPLYPAGALLFGLVLGPGPEGSGPRRLAALGWLAGCVVLGLLGLTGLVVASGLPFEDLVLPHLRPHEADEVVVALAALRGHGLGLVGTGTLIVLASGGAGYNAWGAHWLRASVPLLIALIAVLGGLVAPVERAIAERRTFATFLPEVSEAIGPADLAFAEDSFDYGALFYADRPVTRSRASRSEADYLLLSEPLFDSREPAPEVLRRSSATGVNGRTPLLLVRVVETSDPPARRDDRPSAGGLAGDSTEPPADSPRSDRGESATP